MYSKDLPNYLPEHVAKHNKLSDLWITNEGKVYNITKWVDKHPGGKRLLKLFAGRDVTDVIRSYHPFTNKPYEIMNKYHIGYLYEHPTFKEDSGFYYTLRKRVKEYFEENNIDYKNGKRSIIILLLLLFCTFATYKTLYETNNYLIGIICSVFLGLWHSLVLMHVMHDSSHGAIGHSETWWNTLSCFTQDLFAGASMTQWLHQHLVGHHTYTNVFKKDPDIPYHKQGDIRRVSMFQKYQWFYKFQHVYMFILYGLLPMKIRIQDLTKIFSKKNGLVTMNVDLVEEISWQLFTKTFWFYWKFTIPYSYMGVSAYKLLWSFVISDLIHGYYLTLNFQVSHVTPITKVREERNMLPSFYLGRNMTKIDEEWAIWQVRSTMDYGHNNPITTFLSGALNYQVVHHLFPSISQYYYPEIAPIVKQVCKECGIKYNEVPDFTTAIKMHYDQLKIMGHDFQHH